MIDDAINGLLQAYNRDEEIEKIKELRKIVSAKLKYYTPELIEGKLKTAEENKDNNYYYCKAMTEYEIFKLNYEIYSEMDRDMSKYDKLNKELLRKTKKLKQREKDILKIDDMYSNLRLEW